jgi:hypothetical protein
MISACRLIVIDHPGAFRYGLLGYARPPAKRGFAAHIERFLAIQRTLLRRNLNTHGGRNHERRNL